MQIEINNRSFRGILIHYAFDKDYQVEKIKLGKVVIDYNLSHENVSKINFILKDDDGSRVVHTVFIKGKGRQEIDGLLFTRIEIDGNFEDTKIYNVVKELI